MSDRAYDFDWLIIGSGFGGSVAALRLAEKGYRVGVLECGRRYGDEDFAQTSWQLSKFLWAPAAGLWGILRMSPFKDVFVVSGSGVGGGSLVYANTLYRAKPAFYAHAQWSALADWARVLAPHYDTAERMLGVQTVPFDSDNQQWLKKVGESFGVADTFTRTPCGVFFGAAGVTVSDPYFGGAGPDRTGCTRCGACMVGCRVGAKNTLVKNYLWFAERQGVRVLAEHQVSDLRPIDGDDGAGGYLVSTEVPGSWRHRRGPSFTARGVVVAAGALGTNRLLAQCKAVGSLPRLSDRLGQLVRTNSEAIVGVKYPAGSPLEPWNDVAISSSIHPAADTHIEFVTYGKHGDAMASLVTLLTGEGTRLTRPLKWLAQVLRHPLRFASTLWPVGWSRRAVLLLVMQTLDNAIAFKPVRRRFGAGVRLTTQQDPLHPNPTYIDAANRAAQWLQDQTGGIAQSALLEALANIPNTAHLMGGAVIGADAATGVVDRDLRAFGYRNLIVCDGSAMPANPGVNPSLTITALAEHAMARVETAAQSGC